MNALFIWELHFFHQFLVLHHPFSCFLEELKKEKSWVLKRLPVDLCDISKTQNALPKFFIHGLQFGNPVILKRHFFHMQHVLGLFLQFASVQGHFPLNCLRSARAGSIVWSADGINCFFGNA